MTLNTTYRGAIVGENSTLISGFWLCQSHLVDHYGTHQKEAHQKTKSKALQILLYILLDWSLKRTLILQSQTCRNAHPACVVWTYCLHWCYTQAHTLEEVMAAVSEPVVSIMPLLGRGGRYNWVGGRGGLTRGWHPMVAFNARAKTPLSPTWDSSVHYCEWREHPVPLRSLGQLPGCHWMQW